jgi:catechol 2,3-dioxygenase-like lactoylglutathione lyase family enzyme
MKERLTFPPLCQIGVVVKDLDKTMEMYSSLFGVGPWKVVDLPSMDATLHGKPAEYKMRIALAKVGCLVLELIQVLEGETIHTEFIREKGEGIHHIALLVDDLDKAVEEWEAAGIRVLQRSGIPVQEEGDTAGLAYMDTEGLIGIIIELLKVPRSRVEFYQCPNKRG